MGLSIMPIEKSDLKQYKADMQEAFQLGAIEGGFPMEACEVILPEKDIDCSLSKQSAIAYKAMLDGEMVGGAIIVLNRRNRSGELDFLYVRHSHQGRGVGKFMWFEIERLHPEIKVWETCTPYFERRNLHFYVNVCGFRVTAYWNEHFPDPHASIIGGEERLPDGSDDGGGMLGFRKEIKPDSSVFRLTHHICTKRLVLRSYKESDLQPYSRLVTNPRVNCFRDIEYGDIGDVEKELSGKISDSSAVDLVVALADTDDFIGFLFAGFEECRDTLSVGWNFLPEYCSKGYAFEAAQAYFDLLFNEYGIRRITAFTEDDNLSSQKLCKKLGMRLEGLFKEYISFVNNTDGTPHYENTYSWAILKDEWKRL